MHPIAYIRGKWFGKWYVWVEKWNHDVILAPVKVSPFDVRGIRYLGEYRGKLQPSGNIDGDSLLVRWKTAYGKPPCAKWTGVKNV